MNLISNILRLKIARSIAYQALRLSMIFFLLKKKCLHIAIGNNNDDVGTFSKWIYDADVTKSQDDNQ